MKTGVLFLHGFTGGPYEVRPLFKFLEKETDWTLSAPTLSGHGVKSALGKASAATWLMEAELAFKNLQREVDRVVVVGFSMGGLLALYLALRYRVDKLVLLSAAAKYISPRNFLVDTGVILVGSITKKYPPNRFYHLYEYKLRHTPFRAVYEFLRIVKTVEPYYGVIKTPVCIVQGGQDSVVPFASAEYLFNTLGSVEKKLIRSDSGQHHICYNADSNEWFHELLLFIR